MERRDILCLALLVIITVALFINTFDNQFIWDGKSVITGNDYIKRLEKIPFLFTVDYWRHYYPGAKGDYRPIGMVSLAVDYFLWKDGVAGYHFTNLMIHLLNVAACYVLVRILLDHPRTPRRGIYVPFLAALLFAVHPIHTESVTWIKNRFDILASLFFMIAAIFFIKHFSLANKKTRITAYGTALIMFIIALCSKATVIILPLLLIAYIVCYRKKEELKDGVIKAMPFLFLSGGYFLFRGFILKGGWMAGVGASSMEPYSHLLTVLKTLGYYIKLLVLPVDLSAERSMVIPASLSEPAVFFSVIAFIVIAVFMFTVFRQQKLMIFAVLWIFIALLPVSNIIYLVQRPIAEQRLYIPSFGFCIAMAVIIDKIRPRNIAIIVTVLLIAFHSFVTVNRNLDWRDPVTFWKKTVLGAPDKLRAYNNLGNAYHDMEKYPEAISAFEKTIEIDSRDAKAYHNLGSVYEKMGDRGMSESYYKKAIEIDPLFADAYYNLGTMYMNTEKRGDAILLLEKAVMLDPRHAKAYNNLGMVYRSIGQTEQALIAYKKAVGINHNYANAYHNLGVLYSETGLLEEAMAAYRNAIQSNPDDSESCNNLGAIYAAQGKHGKAVDLYRRAIRIDPRHIRAHNNLGVAYMAQARYEEGTALFKEALTLDPEHAQAHRNLAVAYYERGRYALAIEHCDRALDLGFDMPPDFLQALDRYR